MEYNLKLSHRLSILAEAAYLDHDEIQESIGKEYTNLKFIEHNETQLFIVDSIYGETIISFRGTEPDKIRDWMTDAKIFKKEIGLGRMVHGGFCDEASSVFDDVARELSKREWRKLYITGHSLGADLCILTAFFLSENGIYPDYVCPIAPARPGDIDFAVEYDNILKDVTFCHFRHRDIVTRMPPRMMNNSHVGQTVYINDDGEVLVHIAWWLMEMNRIFQGRIDAIREAGIDDFEDHKISGYVRALANARRTS